MLLLLTAALLLLLLPPLPPLLLLPPPPPPLLLLLLGSWCSGEGLPELCPWPFSRPRASALWVLQSLHRPPPAC